MGFPMVFLWFHQVLPGPPHLSEQRFSGPRGAGRRRGVQDHGRGRGAGHGPGRMDGWTVGWG